MHPLTAKRFFNTFLLNWICLAQNIPISGALAIVAIATEANGVYCLTSHVSHHAYTYVTIIKTISTILALTSVLRMTLPVKVELKKHRAMDFVFSFIDLIAPASTTHGKIISRVDFVTGIPSLILEVELVFFALFFHYAYSIYKVLDIRDGFALVPFAFLIH
ncbi:hypothetical protein GGS21DRAFT_487382 [Xylaria nigripes]|nr:hypothetical protein GGS21DRAFT_487382 [Xylaria nigripes]